MAQGVKNLTAVALVAAVAWIQSPAQELPYAAGVTIKKNCPNKWYLITIK